MEQTQLVKILEGALLASGKPLTVAQLAELFEEAGRPDNVTIKAALAEVCERCQDRGFELVEVASGFRFQVRQELSQWVGRLWHERPQKYSRALLETLALVAYRQPITRGEIEEIRGVAVSSNIIKTLHEREWIRVVGHRDVPGRPAMYATTRQFLDYFNLKSLDQLPVLAEIRDLETLNAELGFNQPLAEQDAAAAGEPSDPPRGVAGLAVVGGRDYRPADGRDTADAGSPVVDTGAPASAPVASADGEEGPAVSLGELSAAGADIDADRPTEPGGAADAVAGAIEESAAGDSLPEPRS